MTSALYPLKNYSIIKLLGDSVDVFLQGQLTADITAMDDNSALLTAHCNPKGRVITLCVVLKLDQLFYLCTPSEMLEITHSALNKYAMFSRIALEDISSTHCLIGSYHCDDEHNLATWYADRFIGITDKEAIDNLATLSEIDWHQKDINYGLPRIYPETSEKFIAQRINLHHIPNAISFKKGCYIGQEIIARVHFLGQLKHEMVYGEVDLQTLKPNDVITDSESKTVGHVVDTYSNSEKNKTMLLAVINSASLGQTLTIQHCPFTPQQISY